MGSLIEINDTLQLTKEQGFPAEFNLELHLKNPLSAEQFRGKIFAFQNKPDIRAFQQPPVRVFLVENRVGKWIYWGLVYITEVTNDYMKKTTSGKFEIDYIYTPEEMKQAHALRDRREDTKFFK